MNQQSANVKKFECDRKLAHQPLSSSYYSIVVYEVNELGMTVGW